MKEKRQTEAMKWNVIKQREIKPLLNVDMHNSVLIYEIWLLYSRLDCENSDSMVILLLQIDTINSSYRVLHFYKKPIGVIETTSE